MSDIKKAAGVMGRAGGRACTEKQQAARKRNWAVGRAKKAARAGLKVQKPIVAIQSVS